MKESSRFLPFLPDFSLFPDFSWFLFLFFPIFGNFFCRQGWHSAPLHPQWLRHCFVYILLRNWYWYSMLEMWIVGRICNWHSNFVVMLQAAKGTHKEIVVQIEVMTEPRDFNIKGILYNQISNITKKRGNTSGIIEIIIKIISEIRRNLACTNDMKFRDRVLTVRCKVNVPNIKSNTQSSRFRQHEPPSCSTLLPILRNVRAIYWVNFLSGIVWICYTCRICERKCAAA